MCGELDVLEDFNTFMGEQPHTHKIVVSGNHDVIFHSEFYENNFWRWDVIVVIEMNYSRYHKTKCSPKSAREILSNCIYLEDNGVTINGINIFGSPWVVAYHNWVC